MKNTHFYKPPNKLCKVPLYEIFSPNPKIITLRHINALSCCCIVVVEQNLCTAACFASEPDASSWDKSKKSPSMYSFSYFQTSSTVRHLQPLNGVWEGNEERSKRSDLRRRLRTWRYCFPLSFLHSFHKATMQKKKRSEVQGVCASDTYTRTCWDHYNTLLCHCHPGLGNLCHGHTRTVHTHPPAHTSNLHSYCYIYCMLTNTISHIPLNWIHRYTHA